MKTNYFQSFSIVIRKHIKIVPVLMICIVGKFNMLHAQCVGADMSCDMWFESGPDLLTGNFSGGVSIGTASFPGAKVDLFATCAHPRAMRITNTDNWLCGTPADLFEIREAASSSSMRTLFYVKNGGNVGIGTNTPNAWLHIRPTYNSTQNYVTIQDNTGINTRLALTSTGMLGVGTPTPLSQLTSSGALPNLLRLENTSSMASMDKTTYMDMVAGTSGHSWRFGVGSANNGIGITGGEYYIENDTGTAVFKIDQTGKVLIGTASGTGKVTTPGDYKLYVEKGILTEKLKVALRNPNTNWADYVFEEDYNLLTVDSVAEYIAVHKHLPGMPSGVDLEKTGIDMAEMNAMLLRQIEELWLHMIELKAQLNTVKHENHK